MNLKLTYLSNDNYMLEKISNEIDSEGASNVPFSIETTVSNALELHYAYYIYNKKIEGIAAKTGTNYVIPNNAFARPGQLILSVHIIDGDSIRVSNPVHYVIKNGANGAVIIDPGSPIEAFINEIKAKQAEQTSQIANFNTRLEALENGQGGSSGIGLTTAMKSTLDRLFNCIAYDGDSEYAQAYEDFKNAFGIGGDVTPTPTKTLQSISAVYNGDDVELNTDINTLKSNIVVTARYSDNSTDTVNSYSLSGNITTVGNNTLTITYQGKTTSIIVVGYAHQEQIETVEFWKYSNWVNQAAFVDDDNGNKVYDESKHIANNSWGLYIGSKIYNTLGGKLRFTKGNNFDESQQGFDLALFITDENNVVKACYDGYSFTEFKGNVSLNWIESIGDWKQTRKVTGDFELEIPNDRKVVLCLRRSDYSTSTIGNNDAFLNAFLNDNSVELGIGKFEIVK